MWMRARFGCGPAHARTSASAGAGTGAGAGTSPCARALASASVHSRSGCLGLCSSSSSSSSLWMNAWGRSGGCIRAGVGVNCFGYRYVARGLSTITHQHEPATTTTTTTKTTTAASASSSSLPLSFYRRPLPPQLIPFSSERGRQLFRESLSSGYMEGYFALAEQYVTQSEPAFCGLSTLAMVLNALALDPRRLWKGAWRWYSEEMLDCCAPLDLIKENGITFDEFACLARCNSALVRCISARNPRFSCDLFRAHVKSCTSAGNLHLVTSFSRGALGQTGDGHFSPIAAYHPGNDLVLVMDVARFKRLILSLIDPVDTFSSREQMERTIPCNSQQEHIPEIIRNCRPPPASLQESLALILTNLTPDVHRCFFTVPADSPLMPPPSCATSPSSSCSASSTSALSECSLSPNRAGEDGSDVASLAAVAAGTVSDAPDDRARVKLRDVHDSTDSMAALSPSVAASALSRTLDAATLEHAQLLHRVLHEVSHSRLYEIVKPIVDAMLAQDRSLCTDCGHGSSADEPAIGVAHAVFLMHDDSASLRCRSHPPNRPHAHHHHYVPHADDLSAPHHIHIQPHVHTPSSSSSLVSAAVSSTPTVTAASSLIFRREFSAERAAILFFVAPDELFARLPSAVQREVAELRHLNSESAFSPEVRDELRRLQFQMQILSSMCAMCDAPGHLSSSSTGASSTFHSRPVCEAHRHQSQHQHVQ